MRMIKKLLQKLHLILICIIFSMISISMPVYAVQSDGHNHRTVKVGYTDYGMMIQENNGEFTGYGVEYLQRLSEYTGWEYEFIPVTEDSRIDALKSGKIDLICDLSEGLITNDDIIISEDKSGLYYGLICAKEDDESVCFEEYDKIDGKRIAVNKSHNMKIILDEFVSDQRISYEPVYCNSFSELEEAVEEGRADLMFASNQRDLAGYKFVAKAGVCNQFFAVSADNAKLMEMLNYADRQLKVKQPFIESFLYEKYYGRPSEVLTGITREEFDLINNGKPIKVVCDGNSYPVEYVDTNTGEYKGIYADAMKLISAETGLQFEFIPQVEYKNAWEMLQHDEVDMAAGMYVDDEIAQTYDLLYSDSYISANYTLISKEGSVIDVIHKIAVPKNFVGLLSFISTYYPEWEVVKGNNVEDCLQMVADGDADGTFINSVFLQTVYNMNNYNSLAVYPMQSFELPIRCTFAGENAEILRQIINKAIRKIPEESFNNCTIENSVNIAYKPGIKDFLREYLPLLSSIIGFLIVIYLIALWFREKHYRHIAMTDSLTGLWNGRCFREKVREELLHNHGKQYLLISLDIEHFKYINNDFGEKAADRVLVVIADRLRSLFGKEALYAREMGDRFLILIKKCDNIEELLIHLTEAISFKNNQTRQHYKPVMKFGICNLEADKKNISVATYIDAAVSARKSIKRDHMKQFAYYDDYMETEAKVEARIEKRMENALEEGEFTVFYQPKYLLETDEIIGAEALVRWNDPNEGIVSPGAFIPIFERNGFIIQLDFFVYEEVIKELSKRIQEGKRIVPISVNVSRIHISTGDFLQKLIALTEKYHLERKLVELELTETVLGGKRQNTIGFIKECKAAGFPISIDDFGSGYSSLNLLKEMPVDVLKIDREFLNELEESEKSSIIVQQVVEMARRIQIKTLCEGVETMKQAEFLKEIGCNMVQGYLYSRPVPLDKFEALLDE